MDRLWSPLLNRTLEAVPLRSRQRRLRVVLRRSCKGTPPLMQSVRVHYCHIYPFQEITITGADSRIECCVCFSFILPYLQKSPQKAGGYIIYVLIIFVFQNLIGVRKPWSEKELKLVRATFQKYFQWRRPPTYPAIDEAMEKHPELAARTRAQIKTRVWHMIQTGH